MWPDNQSNISPLAEDDRAPHRRHVDSGVDAADAPVKPADGEGPLGPEASAAAGFGELEGATGPSAADRVARTIAAMLLVGCLFIVGARLMEPSTLPVQEVVIEGAFRRLQPQDLSEMVSGLVRGGFLQVDVEAIRGRLREDPWVADVMVQRAWPLKIRISVVEQQAFARWGDTALINAEGVLFAPPKTSFPSGLPALSGPAGTEREVMKRYRGLAADLARLGQQVATLDLDKRGGWSFRVNGGPMVIVGRQGFEERLRRLEIGYRHALANIWGTLDTVDLRYTNGFAVKTHT
jgi:cell division protein FtsQ